MSQSLRCSFVKLCAVAVAATLLVGPGAQAGSSDEQTAKATEEIGAQIVDIQNATDEISSAIASSVEEQGAATQEIATSVQRAASNTNEVSSNISDVTDVASETGKAAN